MLYGYSRYQYCYKAKHGKPKTTLVRERKISICYFEESLPHVFVISASENVKWQNVFLNTGNHEWRIPHKIFMIKLVLDAVMQFNHPEECIFLPLVTLVFKYLLASTLQLHWHDMPRKFYTGIELLTLHIMGSNFTYLSWGGGNPPPCQMALSGCFWLKSTKDSKNR